jgi:hypothetical protein
MRRQTLPESFLAVHMRSLQTPYDEPNHEAGPSLQMPIQLLSQWGIGEGSALYTRDHGLVTVLSPRSLRSRARAVAVRRQVQAGGLAELPATLLGDSQAVSNEIVEPVGVVYTSAEGPAVVASRQTVTRRLGSISLDAVEPSVGRHLERFVGTINECEPGDTVYADGRDLWMPLAGIMSLAFPEIGRSRTA